MNNPWMYENSVVRVRDIYGYYHWISKRWYDNPERLLIPICRGTDGLRRTYTKAGRDGRNMLHRENIKDVLRTVILREDVKP